LSVQGNVVKLGLEAPKNINIVRGEIQRHGEVQPSK
jgi:carbon storage regulator CsrA